MSKFETKLLALHNKKKTDNLYILIVLLLCRELAMNAKLVVQMDGKRTRIFNTKVTYIYSDSEECFRNTFDSAPRQRIPCTEVFYSRKTSPYVHRPRMRHRHLVILAARYFLPAGAAWLSPVLERSRLSGRGWNSTISVTELLEARDFCEGFINCGDN